MRALRGVTVIAIVVMAACGGGDAPPGDTAATGGTANPAPASATGGASASAPTGGPCSYITEADASKIVGHPMQVGATTQQGECMFISSSGDPTFSVSFQVHPTAAMYDQVAGGSGFEPVSGIGEKAVVQQTGASGIVAAVKGGRMYLGGVYNANGEAAVKQQSVEFARKVVARM